MTWHRHRHITLPLLVLLTAVVGMAGHQLTASADSPAVVGTAVYQGAVTVTTGETTLTRTDGTVGPAMMELGNSGTDIASTDYIVLRPNGAAVTAANGVRFQRDANNRTSVLAPGGICFAVGGCSTTWPVQGAGVTYWQLISGFTHYLQPVTLTDRLQFAKTSGRGLYALDITANSADWAMRSISNGGGIAAQFDNGLTIGNDLDLTFNPANQILLYDKAVPGTTYQVWNPNNDGHTSDASGPDASQLDGNNLEFRFVPNAVGSAVSCGGATSGDRHCFCAQISGAVKCVRLQ